MSDQPNIAWTGSLTPEELAANVARHPFSTLRETLMTKVALAALSRSMPLTPVATGLLRRSETTRVEPGGLKGWLGTSTIYAPFVHDRVPFFEQGITESAPERDKLIQESGDAYLKSLT